MWLSMSTTPPDARRELPVPGPYDLRRSLSHGYGAGDPSTQSLADGMWLATRTEAGPATMRARVIGGVIEALAWGPGAHALLDRAPDLLGLNDDPGALTPTDPTVRGLQQQLPGMRLTRGRALTSTLFPTIIGQRVTGLEAKRSWRRLCADLGEPAPGPAPLRLLPTPAAMRQVPQWRFHRYGIESSRARVLLRVAWAGERVDAAAQKPPAELYHWLQQIPGIGPWTAAIAVAGALGWPDAVPLGDYNLPRVVGFALAGEREADDARMLQLLSPYRGQRWRVIKLAKYGGRKAERRGPRLPAWQAQVDLPTKRHER